VYFAITTGEDSYVGLTQYFQLEGMAYHLVPIIATNTDEQIGRIETDTLYHRMMNQFTWEGMNDPDIYLDETNRRMVMNFRNVFGRLANALAEEGQYDKAVEVSKRCLEAMPHEVIPFDYFITPLTEALIKAGELEVADSVMNILINRYDEDITYYFSFDADELFSDKVQAMLVQERVVQVYSNIVDEYLKAGQTEKAMALTDRLAESLVTIAERSIIDYNIMQSNSRLNQVKQQSVALMNMLADILRRNGEVEKASEISDKASTYYTILRGGSNG
jgi:tetratricopeptide (TPR) repeat protein